MIEDADILAETVRAFAAHMATHFRASIGLTPAWLHVWARVQGQDPRRFAFTVGRTIYLPVPVGPTVEGWAGWSQMTLIAHECQHVHQDDDGRGLVARTIDYVASTARRTQAESEAFGAMLELEMWRRGAIADWWPRVRATSLLSYHVTAQDIEVARRHLLVLAPTVRRYGYVTEAGRVAIQWLDVHAPELRHPSVRSRAAS